MNRTPPNPPNIAPFIPEEKSPLVTAPVIPFIKIKNAIKIKL